MEIIKVSFGDMIATYFSVSDAMNAIEALYRAFYVHNYFDEWEDIEASRKLDAIEKWLRKALEQDKPAHRKLAGLAIHVNQL